MFYVISCIIKRRTTPGTPKKPAIIEVTGFIPMLTPTNPPRRFTRSRVSPPTIPLITNCIMILMGTTKSKPNTYSAIIPTAKATILLSPSPKQSPLTF